MLILLCLCCDGSWWAMPGKAPSNFLLKYPQITTNKIGTKAINWGKTKNSWVQIDRTFTATCLGFDFEKHCRASHIHPLSQNSGERRRLGWRPMISLNSGTLSPPQSMNPGTGFHLRMNHLLNQQHLFRVPQIFASPWLFPSDFHYEVDLRNMTSRIQRSW